MRANLSKISFILTNENQIFRNMLLILLFSTMLFPLFIYADINEESFEVYVSKSLIQLMKHNATGERIVIVLLKDHPEISELQSIRRYSKSSEKISYNQLSKMAENSQYVNNCKKTLTEYAELFSGGGKFATVEGRGELNSPYLFYLNALMIKVPIENIGRLAALPFVKEIWDGEEEIQPISSYVNETISMKAAYDLQTLRNNNWGYTNIGADKINQRGFEGQGLTIAIIDTGFDEQHPLYNPLWDKPYDPTKINVIAAMWYITDFDGLDDQDGHGTATTGVVWQIVPKAYFIICEAPQFTYQIINSFDWANKQGAQVITTSLGTLGDKPSDGTSELARAASAAADYDTTVVAAAGNWGNGDNYPVDPSTGLFVLSISSIQSDNTIYRPASPQYSYPNYYGEIKPTLAAPGRSIYTLTTVEKGYVTYWSGSSFAAPHVAGSALVLRHLNNNPIAVEEALKTKAIDVPNTDLDGFGRISIWDAAIALDKNPPSNPTSWTSSHQIGVWSKDNTIEVSWSGASDDLSGVYGYSCVWDNNPTTLPDTTVDQTITYSVSFPLSTGSSWYLHIRTVDNAGNWNPNALHIGPFYIDVTSPNAPSLSESHCGSSWTTHNSPYFTWNTPGDTGSGVSYYEGSIDGGSPFQVSSPYHPTLSDGIHTFKVRAVDAAGLQSSWSNTITVKIDTTPPAGIVIINGGAAYTNSPSVTLTLDAVDGVGSGVVYMCFSNDGFSWSPWEYYSTSKSWVLTPGDGTKTVYVKYKDYVGLESSPSSDTIILDTSPPTTPSLSSPNDGARVNPRPTFSWVPSSDSTSGVASYILEIDTSPSFNTANLRRITGITATSYTLPEDLPIGTWYWRVCAEDNAGNTGSFSSARRMIVDRIKITAGGVSDNRLDVGMPVKVWFYAVYESDGMLFDSSKGIIYIDGKTAQWSPTNSRWELIETQSMVQKKTYRVTGVSDTVFGLTTINDVAGPQEVIWDRIKIDGYEVSDSRVDVNSTQTVYVTAVYEYDGTPFTNGVLKINGTDASYDPSTGKWSIMYSSSKVGKLVFKVSSVSDSIYGLTVLHDPQSPIEIIWDRVKVDDYGVASERVNVGSNGLVWFVLKYEYDNSLVNDGTVILNNSQPMIWNSNYNRWEFLEPSDLTGKKSYYVRSISGNAYNITALAPDTNSKLALIIWDRIKITGYSVSSGRAGIGSQQKVYVTAVYEYDDTPFVNGQLYVNDSLAVYDSTINKWVATVSGSTVQKSLYRVSSIRDYVYNLSLVYDTLPPVAIVWDRVKITEWGAIQADHRTKVVFDSTHGQDIIYGYSDLPRYVDMLRRNGYDVIEIRSTITDVWSSFEGSLRGDEEKVYTINVTTNVDRLTIKVEWNATWFVKVELYDPNGRLIQRGRKEVHAHNPSLGTWSIRLYSGYKAPAEAYYRVFVGTGPDPFPGFLQKADVLIVFEEYQGEPYVFNNYCPIYFSFSSQEAQEVNRFVQRGGGLFVGTSFRKYLGERIAINDLLQGFAIRFREGMVYDSSNNYNNWTYWPIIHNFANHRITKGMTNMSYIGSGIVLLDMQRAGALAWSDEDSWLDLPPVNDRYDSGEPLGNITVLAYSMEGHGRVVAHGGCYLIPEELFLRIISWLSESKRSLLVNTGDTVTIWCRAEYEYDGSEFNSTCGTLFINCSAMTWFDSRSRWEYNYSSALPTTLKFSFDSAQDRVYGSLPVYDETGPKQISWTELQLDPVIASPAAIVDTDTTVELSARVVWAHNGSVIIGAEVALNGTLMSTLSNSTGWVQFTLSSKNVPTEMVYVLNPIGEPTGTITKGVGKSIRVTWTELKVEEVKIDKQMTNTGDPINIYVKVIWAHNGSACIGSLVGLNASSLTGTTNSSGWAGISVVNNNITSLKYSVKALRDALGFVTKSNAVLTPSLLWTELWVDDMLSDKSLLIVGEYVMIKLHAVWAHNSSDLVNAAVSVDGIYGYTNQTGWATILVTKNIGGTYILIGNAVSDALGMVTKCTQTKNLTVSWTALRIDEIRWDKDFVNIGEPIKIYAHLVYAHNFTPIVGGSVILNNTVAVTNSTGWAEFNVSSDSPSSYVYSARGLRDGIGWVTVADNNQSHRFSWTAINISHIFSNATLSLVNGTVEIVVRAVWAHNGSTIPDALVNLESNLTSCQSYTNASGYAVFQVTAGKAGEYLYNATGKEAYGITKALGSKSITIRFGFKRYVSLSLKKGYNLIALPLLNESLTASSLLKLIGNLSQSVFMFNTTTQKFVSYDKSLVEFGIPQPDFKIEPNFGYFVYVSNDTSFQVVGIENSFKRIIPVKAGYNLLGWTHLSHTNVTSAFINYSLSIDSVFMFNATIQRYVSYDRALAEFGIPQTDFPITPGTGYFVFANKDDYLYYGGES